MRKIVQISIQTLVGITIPFFGLFGSGSPVHSGTNYRSLELISPPNSLYLGGVGLGETYGAGAFSTLYPIVIGDVANADKTKITHINGIPIQIGMRKEVVFQRLNIDPVLVIPVPATPGRELILYPCGGSFRVLSFDNNILVGISLVTY